MNATESIKPFHRLLLTRSQWHEALREALQQAAEGGCRQIWLCDVDFSDWPLSEPGVMETLASWALPHRKLILLASSYEEMSLRHARWVQWRRHCSHVVECRSAALESSEFPCVLLAPGALSVRLVDRLHYRGSLSGRSEDAVSWRDEVDAVLQQSEEAFPVTTLGL